MYSIPTHEQRLLTETFLRGEQFGRVVDLTDTGFTSRRSRSLSLSLSPFAIGQARAITAA